MATRLKKEKKTAQKTSAADFIPAGADWHELKEASKDCRGCDLYKYATQTVFGEGRLHAKVMMVGEAPGDQEDKQGRPFVGPAGRILNQAIEKAGLARPDVYITNAVKHFKFFETRHYRQHRNPSGLQVNACRPWLEAEIAVLKPKIVVCLGAVAARSLLKRAVVIGKERGVVMHPELGPQILITSHPSSILRMKSHGGGDKEFQMLVNDLKLVRKFLLNQKTYKAAA
jgi:uracil-DNA glycosylase